jgi:hypothetical protein
MPMDLMRRGIHFDSLQIFDIMVYMFEKEKEMNIRTPS